MQGTIKLKQLLLRSYQNTFSAHKPASKQAYNDYISSITCCSNNLIWL